MWEVKVVVNIWYEEINLFLVDGLIFLKYTYYRYPPYFIRNLVWHIINKVTRFD